MKINLNKVLKLIIALVLIFTFNFCDDETPADGFIELRYDANNFLAPILPANTYESAVMFPSNFSGNDEGNKIVSIDYYIEAKPTTAFLKIYIAGNLQPDSLIYDENIINQISEKSFNTHTLTTPITLSGDDNIWIGIEYTQSNFIGVVGCDQGPAKTNGDWLYDSEDELFKPIQNLLKKNFQNKLKLLKRK